MADQTLEGIARPKGRVKSCTCCRQVKLRCDAVAKFPAACSRCKQHGLDCRIDSNFKRVSVRGRLEEMTRKVNSLQGHATSDTLAVAPSTALDPGPGSCTNSATSFAGDDWIQLSDFELNHNRRWCLGEVVLDYQKAAELLTFYAQNYYDHLPILDRVTSISELHDSNPLLFWGIMRIACSRHPEYNPVFQLSTQPYQQLLSTHIIAPIRDFRTIQAMLILCYWPNSGPRESQDPSWQLCGTILNAAMQMGLDQQSPERLAVGFAGRANTHQMSVHSRQMTWLACFHISTSLSVWFGLPPPLSSSAQLNAITTMCRELDIPRSFTAQIEIQQQIVHYSSALSSEHVDGCTTSTLLTLFNNELDAILATYRSAWSPKLEVQLLGAKLYLYSLCLTIASKRRSNVGHFGESRKLNPYKVLAQLGLPSAVSLIHNVSNLNSELSMEMDGSSEVSSIIHFPKHYFRLTMFAVAFLMKFLSSSSSTSQEDREMAVSHITIAHQLFSQFPSAPDLSRTAEIIELLVKRLHAETEDADTNDPIRTRLGASLFYDIMRPFRRPFAEPKEASTAIPTGVFLDEWNQQAGAPASATQVEEFSAPNWSTFDPGSNLTGSQANLEDGLETFQWMSDDVLFEILSL